MYNDIYIEKHTPSIIYHIHYIKFQYILISDYKTSNISIELIIKQFTLNVQQLYNILFDNTKCIEGNYYLFQLHNANMVN